jgi:mono/diheme cytochrome c family protein
VKRMDECGCAATWRVRRKKTSFYLSPGFLFLIAALVTLWMVAPPILAQSNKPPEGSSKPESPQPAAKAEPPVDTSAPEGDPERGKQLFQSVGCADCHGNDAEGRVGPPLIKLQKTFKQYEDQVRHPIGAMPNEFPPELVSEDDLIDIYAFLKHPPGSSSDAQVEGSADNSNPKADAENGKKLFTSQGCDKCHGPDQHGGASGGQLNAIPDSLQGLIDYIRHPTGQMPAYAATAIPDKELADIYAYMKSRPKT